MFKSESERFLTSRFDKPGPGSYELATKSKPNLARDTLCTLLAASRGRCNSKVTPPSIPTDHLGYQEDQHKEMKKVQPIPGNPPSPGSYELKSTMGSKGVLPWKPSKAYYKEEDQPGPGWYERKDRLRNALSSCFNSTTGRFMGKQT